MRNSKSHTKTIRKKLTKCESIFNAFNDLQFKYGIELDKKEDIKEIKVNVKLIGCELGDSYTTDFYCLKTNGNI